MSTTTKRTSMRSSAGKKEAGSGKLKPSYALKDKCRQLTVGDYIEMVCYDNLQPLVLEGKPTKDVLREALMEVLAEFAELSGSQTSPSMMLFLEIIDLRAKKVSYTAALYAMRGEFEGGKEFFRSKGLNVSAWTPDKPNPWLRRINSEIIAINGKIEDRVKKYNALATKNDGKKATEKDIRQEISALSQHQAHAIADDCNLATYAGHRLSYNNHLKSIENAKHRVGSR